MKRCTKCRKWKDKSEFSKNKSKKDGYATECKECAYPQKSKWASGNPDKVREYKLVHPENPEKKRERNRIDYYKRREVDVEKERKRVRDYGRNHPNKVLEWVRNWRKNNREKARMQVRNRRARVLGSDGKITIAQWEALKEFYNYICLRCGRREPEISLTLDHVIPIDKGGSNTIDNAQCLCGSCNSIKHTQYLDYRPIIFYG